MIRNRYNRAELTMAKKRFMAGPAAATNAISLLGLNSFLGSMGTGLAHPNKNPPGKRKIKERGTRILPMGSICGSGFNVRRPRDLAVGSPK